MVSHDLLRSTVTYKIALDQRDSKSISNFERTMNRCCQALVSRFFSGFHIGNLEYHQLQLTDLDDSRLSFSEMYAFCKLIQFALFNFTNAFALHCSDIYYCERTEICLTTERNKEL